MNFDNKTTHAIATGLGSAIIEIIYIATFIAIALVATQLAICYEIAMPLCVSKCVAASFAYKLFS